MSTYGPASIAERDKRFPPEYSRDAYHIIRPTIRYGTIFLTLPL